MPARAVAGAALAALVLLVSPWKMVDPDALSRLASGRQIVAGGGVPATDPFTFTAPDRPWSNPEWLGDVLFYSIYRASGERGLLLFKLTVIAGGMLLVWLLAMRRGASPVLTASLLVLMLPGCLARFTLRNHIHAFWLVPLYGLLLDAATRDRRWLWALVPAGALWANLHGSFPLGWLLMLAAGLQWWQEGRRGLLLWLAGLLGLHLALPLLGPNGTAAYGQLVDHLTHAEIYRSLILEWRSPLAGPSHLALFPLFLVALVGLPSFLPAANRQPGPLLLVITALAAAALSARFLPLLVLLALPPVALNLTRLLASARLRRAAMAVLVVLAVGLAAPLVWAARTDLRRHVLRRDSAPLATARCLASLPEGSRLFNDYDAGPWLLWLVGPRVELYIDPRNNLGAPLLRRYIKSIVPHPALFEQEVRRHRITLCLVNRADPRYGALATHLARGKGGWRLAYSEGSYALYARGVSDAAAMCRGR